MGERDKKAEEVKIIDKRRINRNLEITPEERNAIIDKLSGKRTQKDSKKV